MLNALVNRLDDDDSTVRSLTADALGKLGQGNEAVLNALMERLADNEWNVRSRAADALSQLGKQTASVAPQLAAWLEHHQQSDDVGNVVDALWRIVTEQG
ncbi:MAG: HEAT repeat domain-containing protein [Cyanobacteria bacterium J06638_6]